MYVLPSFATLDCVFAAASIDWAAPGMAFDVVRGQLDSIQCSVGFPATDKEGNKYFLTAGHCFRDGKGKHLTGKNNEGLYIYRPDEYQTPIGYEYASTATMGITYVDLSLVKMFPGRTLAQGGWSNIPTNYHDAAEGDQACLAGSMHEVIICGTVVKKNIDINMNGFNSWSERVNETDYCGIEGDSGGAVYNRKGALGIHIAGLEDNAEKHADFLSGEDGCKSYYVLLNTAIEVFHNAVPSLKV